MSLSSDELWQRIPRAGLATAEQCRQWSHEILPKLSHSDAQNGLKLLLHLVDAGHVSKYQAKIIAGQSTEPIRYGAWVIEQPVKLAMWQGWYEVRRGASECRWARPVTAAELPHLRPLLPSLPRALKLAALQLEGLLAVQPPELIDGTLLIFVASPRAALQSAATAPQAAADLARGHLADTHPVTPHADAALGISGSARLLCQEFANRRCPPDEATRLVGQLAHTLSVLHGQQIVHGRVLPDRIYVHNQRVVLVVDPLCAATGLPQRLTVGPQAAAAGPAKTEPQLAQSTTGGLIGSVLRSAVVSQFCAPEMRLPEPLPSPASDVFSLGGVWWWLLTGEAPPAFRVDAAGQAPDAPPAPGLPADCSLPEPLWRCLQACLAQNPANRFASATELQRALLVAQRARPLAVAAPQPQPQPQPQSQSQSRSQLQSQSVGKPVPTVQPPAALQPVQRKPMEQTPQLPVEQLPAQQLPAQPIPAQQLRAQQPTLRPALGEQPHAQLAGTGTSGTAAEIPRRRRRRQGIPWLWPILGGGGVLIGLLLLLKFTGALQPSRESSVGSAKRPIPNPPPSLGTAPAVVPPVAPAVAQSSRATDPRSPHYEIVPDRPGAKQRGLWAPPTAPAPLPLDLLPPGGQLFLSLRPEQWPSLEQTLDASSQNTEAASLAWSDVLGPQVTELSQQLQAMSGVPLVDTAQVTLAFYAAEQSGQPPRVCARFHLSRPKPLAELTAAWNAPADGQVSEQRLWIASPQQAFYIPRQTPPATGATAESQGGAAVEMVSEFSVGPADMLREVAELDGARGPLLPHLEKLWNATDRTATMSLLISTPFLFTEGRDLLNVLPSPLSPALRQWLGGDVRGASMQVHWQPQWYLETRVVGTSDMDAGKILARQQQQVQSLPAMVEQWLVSHNVHPYWRGLAMRYPHMLRTFVDYSRFGVEHGTALMNSYLPSQGGTNLALTSWIALQDYATSSATANVPAANATAANATAAATGAARSGSTAAPVEDIETYLSQAIDLSFDQEPIEVALQMVADEANAHLPPGAQPLRFVLDGAAFGKAGITRNQQLSDFRIQQQSVRDALTEIARRGNPVTTVTDLRDADQRLLWIVAPDPNSSSGASMISLTTRTAAKESGYALPKEFAPES